jgi:hypothetical protein
MAGKRAETLLEVTFFIKRFTLDRAWTGLTDDEFFWEPTPETWSVRPVTDSRTKTPFVRGEWEADYDSDVGLSANWAQDGEPLTNIAWLYWHVGSMPGRAAQLDFFGGPHSPASGWSSPYLNDAPIFTNANEAVSTMQAGWRTLVGALQSASDETLEAPTRFWGYGGPGREGTGSQIVASILNEVSHHATQIGAVRDFYRARMLTA